jgi:hypothetical protein
MATMGVMAARVTSGGFSGSTKATQRAAMETWKKFAITQQDLNGEWDDYTEADLCNRNIWELYCGFILDTYKIEGGPHDKQPLSYGSFCSYIGSLLHQAKNKFRASGWLPQTELFFTCLDLNSHRDEALWYRGIKHNMKNTLFKRRKEAGTPTDNRQTPVYISHVKQINRAYSLQGSKEAMVRKFTMTTLQRSVGRTGEVAWITWDGMEWDPCFQCVFVEVPESKNSTMKFIPFSAGKSLGTL